MTAMFPAGRTFVIAEVGPNHNGSIDRALEIVRQAASSGIDAIKFQTFVSGKTVVSDDTPLAAYMEAGAAGKSQNDLHDELGLTFDHFRTIAAECKKHGVPFSSTPFDVPSVEFLAGLGVPFMKIPSGEITNPFLLRAVARTGLPTIMSTGMAELGEIRAALELLRSEWRRDRRDAPEFVLLHCTSAYPAPLAEVNLRAMDLLTREYGVPVGYSDHTLGSAVSIAAVARGARVIEKHVTQDVRLHGPDHAASLPLDQLPAFVASIRAVTTALGSEEKRLTTSERDVRKVARRSLAALRDIAAGETFSEPMLTALRPERGLPPMNVGQLLGRQARRSYRSGEIIDVREIEH